MGHRTDTWAWLREATEEKRWQSLCQRDDDIEVLAGGAIFERSDYLPPGLGEDGGMPAVRSRPRQKG